jgi:DNA-binding PadR family transcriptional regulator
MGRFFEHGDLRLVALQLCAEKPRHGYEIIKEIEKKSGGAYTPSAGAVYPTLTLLQELGQLTVTDAQDGRKLYTITPEGEAALVANRKAVDVVFARIAQAGESRGPAPVIEDAFRKLKLTLRLRLAQGPIDDALAKTIAEKLNEVSDTIAE